VLGLGADVEERIEITIERGRVYLQAGADLVFVPVLIDPEVVRQVTGAIKGPISLMAMPGAPASIRSRRSERTDAAPRREKRAADFGVTVLMGSCGNPPE
jgi:hypothetical protein